MKQLKNIINWQPTDKKEFLFENITNIPFQKRDFLFSVVIAVYNSEQYIEETIESILNQDIGFNNIQLILVDDGSTDSSLGICIKYARKYPKNILVIHKENGGVSSARNVGMQYVLGKYINFIDSDDIWGTNVFSKVKTFFDKNESKVDVVTVKNELFGLKKGGTWFNKKFEQGDRVINLWKEPKIYLNSTNCTFFHARIKNQLVFDEQLSISEDLKVVNSVLMNKWALGVIASGTYYYRIRSAEDGSLASSARNKECWYFTYLDRVAYWLFEKAQKQCDFIPEFLQHTLLRDLFNRFNENKQCEAVLQTSERIAEYKKKLFGTLKYIDDKIIKSSDYINTDYQIYFFSIKYGRPSLSQQGTSVKFSWNNNSVSVTKQLCVMWEKCYVKNESLFLEGYVICNNFNYDHKNTKVSFEFNGKTYSPTILKTSHQNDKLAFADEYIFYRNYFVLEIDNVNKKANEIKTIISINREKYVVLYNAFGKWCGVSSEIENSYFYDKGMCLYVQNKQLVARKISKLTKNKFERKFLKYLKTVGKSNPEYAKGYKVRKAHNILKKLQVRPLWIASDRNVSAGDSGEVFYEYLKKKKHINSIFTIRKNDEFDRLKKKRFKLLNLDSRKYKLKWLCADAIISSHLDKIELEPISLKFIRDIVAKKKFVFLQHGIIKDDLSSIYSRKSHNLDIFVTSTKPEYDSIVHNPNYFCDESVTKLTGLPRFDKLYDSDEKIVLIMPTWRHSLVVYNGERNSICDNFKQSYFYKFYRDLLTNEKLHEICANHGYKLCFFIHSNLLDANKYFEDIPNLIIPTISERNYTDMFAKASVMITDYSSTAFDFAYLRKPIIYCQGDENIFFSKHTYSKGYFDYKRDGFGDVVNTVEETVDSLEKIFKNNRCLENKYLERINKTFPFSDKNNCERVYKEIKNLTKD